MKIKAGRLTIPENSIFIDPATLNKEKAVGRCDLVFLDR